jgi:hypothetical protein
MTGTRHLPSADVSNHVLDAGLEQLPVAHKMDNKERLFVSLPQQWKGSHIICASRHFTLPSRRITCPQLSSLFLSPRRRMASIQMSRPSVFASSGFSILDASERFDEETLPDYLKVRYYPVHIGQVFKSEYQIVTKLGFGSASTVWLCRDLR